MRLQREADGNLSQALLLRMRGAASTLSHTSSCRGVSITITFNSPLRWFVQNGGTNDRPARYEIHATVNIEIMVLLILTPHSLVMFKKTFE
jgi:hypothetical protein